MVGMESGPRWQIEDDTTGRGGEEEGEEAGMEIFLMLMWSLTWRILPLAEDRHLAPEIETAAAMIRHGRIAAAAGIEVAK